MSQFVRSKGFVLDGSGLEVVPAAVAATGARLSQVAQTLISAMAAVDADIRASETAWKGHAGETFRAGWAEVHDGARTVLAALERMAGELGVQARSYNAADSTAANILNSVDNRLNIQH